MEGNCIRRGHARFRRSKVTDPLDSLNPHSIDLNVEPSSKDGGIFDLDLNVEPDSSSKSSMCLDLSLNVEPGSSSERSVVCLELSSNQKPPGIFHQNLNIISCVCLDLSSNRKAGLFHQNLNVTSCKRSVAPVYHTQYQQQQQQQQQYKPRPLFSSMEDGNNIVDPQYPFGLKRLLMCSGFGATHDDAPARSCHCCVNARRNRVKKTIIVPAISNKMSDIPRDAYSWRKYGQKPIKNSHHPRGYYKCSLSKECPAKKWVERCSDDPTKLRITYQNNHNHPNINIITRPHP